MTSFRSHRDVTILPSINSLEASKLILLAYLLDTVSVNIKRYFFMIKKQQH